MIKPLITTILLGLLIPHTSYGVTVWSVGKDDNFWPVDGVGGGEEADFLQENGNTNPMPGNPNGLDNDYYFAGSYTIVPTSLAAAYGSYTPVGTVTNDEISWERAFSAGIGYADDDLRVHFNLPSTFGPNDLATISFDFNDIDQRTEITDPRYGVEVYFNGVLVSSQQIIYPSNVNNQTYTTNPFTLSGVNAVFGPGGDNVVSLRGISYYNAGGSNWMGIDYVKLDVTPVPEPTSALLLGLACAGLMIRFRRA